MPLQKIDPLTFKENIFQKIGSEWFLLTAGNEENCNTMTAAWGGLGFLWGKNVATVYVRQSRYTYGFMEETDRFTLSFFGEGNQRDALAFCGSRSGRDVDKFEACGLHKIPLDGSTAIEEAELVITCKKLCRQPLLPESFTDPSVMEHYADHDYHTMYIGEIINIYRQTEGEK